MDHEGEEGAGAEPVDVLEEAQLARLEAAGAPPRLPKQYRHLWLAHAEVPEATFALVSGKLYLVKRESDLATYGKLVTLRLDEESQELVGDCCAPGCGKPTRLTQKPSGVNDAREFKWGNFLSHLDHMHPYYLTHDRYTKGFKQSAERVAGSGSGSGGGKRARDDNGEGVPGRVWEAKEKTELIEWAAKVCVMDARPLALWEGPGMRGFLNHYNFPFFGRTAVNDAIKRRYKEWVTDKIESKIGGWKKPFEVVAGGKKWHFNLPLSFSMDGWVGMNDKYYMSMILHGRQVWQGMLNREQQVIAVQHWLPEEEKGGEGGQEGAAKAPAYTAADLAIQVNRRLTDVKLTPEGIFAVQADNEATNSKFTRTFPFDHTYFLGCAQHSQDLMVHDLMDNIHFREAVEASDKMAVFIRGSEKRMTELVNAQLALGVAKHKTLLPCTPAPTRFLDNIYTQARTLALMDAYEGLYKATNKDSQTIFDSGNKTTYVTLYANLIKVVAIMKSFAPIGKVLTKLSPALGSDQDYTISLQIPLFDAIENAVKEAEKAEPPPSDEFSSILDDLLRSAYARLAPTRFWKNAPQGTDLPEAQTKAYKTLVKRDELCQAGAALDPTTFESFFHNEGDLELTRNFFITNIIKPYSKLVDEGGAAAASGEAVIPETKRKLNLEITAVLAEAKPAGSRLSDEAWKKELERRVKNIKDGYDVGMDDALEAEMTVGSHDTLVAKLVEEMQFLEREHEKARTPGTKDEWKRIYGGPFDQGKLNRKRYWVQRRTEMPVLYCMAMIILPIPFASTSNERVHSVLGRILSKFRCSMNSETLEENLLGYYCLREEGKKATLDERVRQKMSDRQVTTLEALDLEDLKDIF